MKSEFDPMAVFSHFYPLDTPLRRLLLKHSLQVREKALTILESSTGRSLQINETIVSAGALLHDIGIGQCDAPGILCRGKEPYLAHGPAGAAMLRQYAKETGLDLEIYARICERHTGTGITAEEIRLQHLPLPEQDFLPETLEEKLVCLADKFFSKSGEMREKSPERVRQSLEKFGNGPIRRFDALCALFGIRCRT